MDVGKNYGNWVHLILLEEQRRQRVARLPALTELIPNGSSALPW
jgi:hypothetical protein